MKHYSSKNAKAMMRGLQFSHDGKYKKLHITEKMSPWMSVTKVMGRMTLIPDGEEGIQALCSVSHDLLKDAGYLDNTQSDKEVKQKEEEEE